MDAAAELKVLIDKATEAGHRPILVSLTGVPGVDHMLFRMPTLLQLSGYTYHASQPSSGPLMASVGLARQIALSPVGTSLEALVTSHPYAILRAIQVVLRELGLAAHAEKKSLS